MSLITLAYILGALQGPFSQTGVTNDTFRTQVLPNDTFSRISPPVDLPAQCLDFTSQMDNRNYARFNSCIAIANATYDISANSLNSSLTSNLDLVGIHGDTGSIALANQVMTAASNTMLFYCNITRCQRDIKMADVGECNFDTLFPNTKNESNINLLQMSNFYKSVCRNRICNQVAERVSNDPDIGGIGVFISYFMQVVIALVIFGNIIMHNMPSKNRGGITRKLSFLNSERFHRSSEEFLTFAFNFHKSQVWFLSVLLIASYIRRATEDISIVNSFMLLNIALNGVGLLSFTLLLLALLRRDKVDCFIFYTTMFAYLLCLTFMIYILIIRRTEAEDWVHAAGFCEGRMVPFLVPQARWDAIIHYISSNQSLSRSYYIVAMIFCTLVLLSTIILVRVRYNIKKYYDSHKISTLLIGSCVLIAYTLIFIMQFWLMALFIKLATVIWQNQWGFGQIVAVTVWVPVIADYCWDKFVKEKDRVRHLQPPALWQKFGKPYFTSSSSLVNNRQSVASSTAMEEGKVEDVRNGPQSPSSVATPR